MAGLECNKLKTEAKNAIYGEICMLMENKSTVFLQNDSHCSSCYQRLSREAEGCWGGAEGRAVFTEA